MKYAIVHIADIHYRKEESEGASFVIKAFLKDLENQKKSFSEHEFYIAITGDIVKAGVDSKSYERFIIELDQQLKDIGLYKNFRIIVPGNHDIDQNIVIKNFDDYKNIIENHATTESNFNDFISKANLLNNKFENYELFESEFAKYGNCFTPQGFGWEINECLGVYCLNTALCSFGGVQDIDDESNLAIDTRGLVNWCNNKKTQTNILLMHHPPNHLNSWSKNELKQIIENNFTLCLCGHRHAQDVFHNKISQKSLICSAPQLFTNKEDNLGYAIILIEENVIDKIVYRQYVKGNFLNGSTFAENDEGIVDIQTSYRVNRVKLEYKLKDALAFFKGQPQILIEPRISNKREFNDDENLLDQLIKEPQSTIILAQPQFGLTCLSHYMRLEAFKMGTFWIYIDADHTKARKVISEIDEQLRSFDERPENIKCIIIDSWDSSNIDHINILKLIDSEYANTPIIIMYNYTECNFNPDYDFSKSERQFSVLHLQALQRNKVREIVSEYNKNNRIANEDEVVTKVVRDLEVLNVHRTPLNCLTLLKVFEKGFNEDLINRTKMIKAVLFILFTDADSFTYSTNKPDIEDCEYILVSRQLSSDG